MFDYYILKRRKPVRVKRNVLKWAKWLEHHKHRRVRRTPIKNGFVSTVFLPMPVMLDTCYFFETMIMFDGEFLDYQTRAKTYREALRMHRFAVKNHKKIILALGQGDFFDAND